MNSRSRAQALIEFYRSLNPSVVNEWNIAKEIAKDLHEYISCFDSTQNQEIKKHSSDEYYNESY
jgi:hypothetical protein